MRTFFNKLWFYISGNCALGNINFDEFNRPSIRIEDALANKFNGWDIALEDIIKNPIFNK